jgi:hypothetical protein
MDFIVANWKDVVFIFTAVVTAASVIAKFTPNIWDDKITAAVLRFLSMAPKNPLSGALK